MAHSLIVKHSKVVWEKEATEGVDPAGTRRAFPGKVTSISHTENFKHEEDTYLGEPTHVMNSSQKTAAEYSFEMEMYLGKGFNDVDLDDNFFPLMYGDVDAAGVITHRTPNDTFTTEWLETISGNVVRYALSGCKIKTLTRAFRLKERVVARVMVEATTVSRGQAEVVCSTTSLSAVVQPTPPWIIAKDITFSWALKGDVYKVDYSNIAVSVFQVGEAVTEVGGDADGAGTILAVGDDYIIVQDTTAGVGEFEAANTLLGGTSGATADIDANQTQVITPARVREMDITLERNILRVPTFNQSFEDDFLAEDEFAITWTAKFVREHNIFYNIFINDPSLSPGQLGLKMVIDQTSVVATGYYESFDMGVDTSDIYSDLTEHELPTQAGSTVFLERGFSGKIYGGNPAIDFEA
jgi:hypothetical protein